MEMLVMVALAAAAGMGLSGCEAVVLREPNASTTSDCQCVPYFNCQGGSLDFSSRGANCSNFLDICCRPSDIIKDESCECMPFFECTTQGKESEAKKCPNLIDVCCIKSDEELSSNQPETTPPSQPNPITSPTSQPKPTGEPCSTIGTRKGLCIPYRDCSDKLQEPIRLLTIDQFLHNYGCGVDSKKVARVCCPVE